MQSFFSSSRKADAIELASDQCNRFSAPSRGNKPQHTRFERRDTFETWSQIVLDGLPFLLKS